MPWFELLPYTVADGGAVWRSLSTMSLCDAPESHASTDVPHAERL